MCCVGKLAPLAGLPPLSETQRAAAADITMATIKPSPAPRPVQTKMEVRDGTVAAPCTVLHCTVRRAQPMARTVVDRLR